LRPIRVRTYFLSDFRPSLQVGKPGMCVDAGSAASLTPTTPPGQADELERTKSQFAASVKLESVRSHVDQITEPVQELRRSVSQLAKRTASPDLELQVLKEELGAIDQARKNARNFGEDLVEDMLVLDGLGNLIPEDRSNRKRAIAGIESLLDDVDSMKARLNTLQQSLESKLSTVEADVSSDEDSSEPSTTASPSCEPPAPPTASPTSIPARSDRVVPLPPGRDTWRRLHLPVRFRSQEDHRCYVLRASVPNLDTNDIKLSVSNDGASLTVGGLRVPSEDQSRHLHEQLASRFRQWASSISKNSKITERRIREVAESAYLEMGQNRYGSFSETFRLPSDADAAGIEASYQDGVLCVVVPKFVARGRHGFGGHSASPRRSGNAWQQPSLSGARYGGGAPPHFGGFAANFW